MTQSCLHPVCGWGPLVREGLMQSIGRCNVTLQFSCHERDWTPMVLHYEPALANLQ